MNLFTKQKEVLKEPESFQEWLGIEKIENSFIKLTNSKKLFILKVIPINFKLKSKLEQKAILAQYKYFLKNLNSKIQIIISSKKTDISYHLDEIYKSTNENSNIKDMSEDYIVFLNQIVLEKGAITKDFYIVIEDSSNIQNDILMITEQLSNCGNEVCECSKEEIIDIIQNFVNKRIQNLA